MTQQQTCVPKKDAGDEFRDDCKGLVAVPKRWVGSEFLPADFQICNECGFYIPHAVQ